MITHARILKGWPSELPHLKDRMFTFTPGLNVLFGENGSGKSTLLKTIAAYVGCDDHGGWTNLVDSRDDPSPSEARWDWKIRKDWGFPRKMCGRAPHDNRIPKTHTEADVGWDGSAAFFHNTVAADRPIVDFEGTWQDGLMEPLDKLRMTHNFSAGQMRVVQLTMMRDQMSVPRDTRDPNYYIKHHDRKGWPTPYEKLSPDFQRPINEFIEYVKTLSHSGPQTLLLDEPERSLDLPLQECFWNEILANVPCQVIIASHSVFALAAQNANIIGMEGPDSITRAREAIQRSFWRHPTGIPE